MADHSCCSCLFSKYEEDKLDVSVICSKGITVTAEMLMDAPCKHYVKRVVYRTEADEDNEPSETVNTVPRYKKEPPELLSPHDELQLKYKRNDPNEI